MIRSIRPPVLARDLPTVSRYAGHIVLALLFVSILYGFSPRQWSVSGLDALFGRGRDFSSTYYLVGSYEHVASYQNAESNERYLAPDTIPFTMQSWSQALPQVAEPRRLLRTTVTVYTVQAGDTLLQIAQQFGLQGTTILYANESLAGQNDTLSIGQELYILPVDGAYHTVAQGESLESIAAKYKVESDEVALYPGNSLTEPYTLTAGQKLIIPGGVKPYVPKQVQTYPSVGTATQSGVTGTGQLAWPMSGRLSQGYWQGHRAIDIAASRGTPIMAADGGTVVAAHTATGYGRMVVVDHGNGYQTLYAHMDAFFVEVGQAVEKGDLLGKCGSTGNSTGPHLHFEVRSGGSLLNPFNFLP
ncbi:MAG: peptidoglycan DD-metalloendopeptidase family protein [Chloroflexi bacterium]|nr:peptidoglycan DD-metalloendopeptidase family protein [Chloroflexota bacterium]